MANLIGTWAPPSENSTVHYIRVVYLRSGIKPEQVLVFKDKEQMTALVAAMVFVENGQELPRELIAQSYDLC